eukprot:CAMPEP_0205857110 /NCGR_PEP_ID=MMETSP1083-20121108/3488_1 /ASSEMBLY_ACC=CAM_ASM_000430 /TAXON_ID=97485 /ORGANISM="Prymnesium parvum, Strain Texoma1" /LENGTH=32 /DNA_ID= /DNA_START= /DNA_END= /DNA_ORIENTATION=
MVDLMASVTSFPKGGSATPSWGDMCTAGDSTK